jgi:hypothetical protein
MTFVKPVAEIENAAIMQYPDGARSLMGILKSYPEQHKAYSHCGADPGKFVTTSKIVRGQEGDLTIETARTIYKVLSWYKDKK